MSSKLVLLLAALVIGGWAVLDVLYHGHFLDSRLEKNVENALETSKYTTEDGKPIDVEVHDNWVVLDGTVADPAERGRVAESVRQQVRGIRGLTNNLDVKQACDESVLTSLKNLVDNGPGEAKISYLVDDKCNVTLTGWVPTEQLKGAIGELAGSISGVPGVTNNIEVGVPKKRLEDEIVRILRVQNIYFDFNKASIRPQSQPSLDRIAQLLKDNAVARVRIEGHTDSVGSNEYNQRLSDRRAKAVVDALVERNVPRERLEAVGFGETKPMAPNDSPEGRAENRRIEFKIL